MAGLGDLNERLDEVEERRYDPIPDGWYTSTIKSAEIKDTKNGGQQLSIRFDITGPAHAGAVIYNGLNIRNSNPDTEKYAMQDLKAIRSSLGMAAIRDTDELVGRSLMVKVVTQPKQEKKDAAGNVIETYDAKNVTKGYKAIEGGTMPAPSMGRSYDRALKADPVPTASKAPPWAAKAAPVAPPAVMQGEVADDKDAGQDQMF